MSIPVKHAVTISMCFFCLALVTCEASSLRRRSGRPMSSLFERYTGVKSKRPQMVDFGDELVSQGTANNCPEISPWPCKTEGHCLAFDFICDGRPQCPDGYDEDSALCTAKSRPAKSVLRNFITRYKSWFIPDILGTKDIDKLASLLSESKTINDFIKAAELSEDQAENLRMVMNSVKQGRSIDLIMYMALPERMWPELYYFFGRIVRSGFLGDQSE